MPSSRQARMTRRATSPRFATRTLPITSRFAPGSREKYDSRSFFGPDAEERLVVLHAPGVLGQDLDHLPRNLRGRDVRYGRELDGGSRVGFGLGLHGNLQLPLPDPDLADPAPGQKLDEPA